MLSKMQSTWTRLPAPRGVAPVCGALLLSLLAGRAAASLQTPAASVVGSDSAALLQTEVVMRSALAPGAFGLTDPVGAARTSTSKASIAILNTVVVLATFAGLKQWRQPADDEELTPPVKTPSQAARDAAVAEDVSSPTFDHDLEDEDTPVPLIASDNCGERTDIGSFLIAWDCFQ
eukprot:CAMPEP_0168403830 /NCGR_PEP_ID=MMETSP0228-20121227/24330_1 /TAXON_ID=133427 /ORGANISM="Protoceratium reticulatum, Strain CCCM 535 (=CCMP 1889)" /LENGTH=175 /DNA_ID=CAMNT_0008417443 /DNA_START=88 /DNA_END=615 /DNA_ORIENTATION=+